MSGDRIKVGCYGMIRGDESLPGHVLIVRVNSAEQVVAREHGVHDEYFWYCVEAALSDPAEARVMWEMAKGGPR